MNGKTMAPDKIAATVPHLRRRSAASHTMTNVAITARVSFRGRRGARALYGT
jgi:hypothetical protein